MDISVVIPTYNRKAQLRQCLESLFRQDYPEKDFEIIVIDDGSTDGTRAMLEELLTPHPNLRYFSQLHKGPAVARNLGIEEARAEIIGFSDTDCVLDSNWIKNMVEAHREKETAVAVGGKTIVDSHNIKAQVSQFLSDGAIETSINGNKQVIFFPTCNVSFKKKNLNGKFNESFPLPAGEDLDFFWRLYKKGATFCCRPDIEVLHNCHPSQRSFLKQAYMYGRGNYLVQHIHRDHPLLKEIKTQNIAAFAFGVIINFVKIPRFSFLLGKRLINTKKNFSYYEKFQIYAHFALHKIMYLFGNIAERRRISKINTEETDLKPEFIILDLTHRCNLSCNICEIRKDKPIEEFTTEEVKHLITQAADWQVKEFVLSGGEPFMREDIFEILDFVKDKGYHIGVLTNGIILDNNFINKLLPYLVSDSLSLSISLDALSPEIHDEIRAAKGSFEKTAGALKKLFQLKIRYPNINFNSISIILNENLEELLDLVVFLKSLNVNSIQLQPLLANNLVMKERGEGAKYWIPRERLHLLDSVIDKLVEFKKNNHLLVRNSENNLRLAKKYFRGHLSQEDVKCLYATKSVLVANNGDVTTCFESYGNIRMGSLRSIFESKKCAQARKRVSECKNPCLLPCFTDNKHL